MTNDRDASYQERAERAEKLADLFAAQRDEWMQAAEALSNERDMWQERAEKLADLFARRDDQRSETP